jgi:hypothetical protein
MPQNISAELSLERLMGLLDSPCETPTLDFKETLDLTQGRDRVEFAKDVLAMANSGGGHIVVGVEDTTRRRVGIDNEVSAILREAKTVNDKLKKYSGGFVKVLVAQHDVEDSTKGSVRLALIHIPGAAAKIPAQDDGVFPDPVNPAKQKWLFRKGDVYVRKGDESVKVETPEDLQLMRVGLELGIDVAGDIVRSYTQRLGKYFLREIPQLRSSEGLNEMCGESLLQILLAPKNFLLLGPSGSGKSLHLKHFCVAALSQNELPILVPSGRYKGEDLFRLVDLAVAPFSTADSRTLCSAASISDFRIVLVIDGLNECHTYLEQLAKEIHAFRLRYPSRLLMVSQPDVIPAGEFECERVFMAPLTPTQKRFVYCYYARIAVTSEVDYLCQGFSNGYDLALAGRCHDTKNASFTRLELYDRYCRDSLPKGAETVLTALLRGIAGAMGQEVTNFWPRDKFEQYAEKFLAQHAASFGLLDELKSSRLVGLTNDSFSFEHDLLLDYFRAEQMRREFVVADSLAVELAKPRNQSLVPFILTRQTKDALHPLFSSILKVETLREIILGRCGDAARQALISDCKKVYSAALADLGALTLDFTHDKAEPKTLSLWSISPRSNREWTPYEILLCDAIAISLDDYELQKGFLELLDQTQSALRVKAEETAHQSGVSFSNVWQVVVGQMGWFASKQQPFFRITGSLRRSLMASRELREFSLQDQLWTRIERDSEDHFSLAILLDGMTYCQPDHHDLKLYITLARMAWESKIYHLRLNALHLIQSLRWRPNDLRPEELQMIRELLVHFETRNMLLNSSLLELQSIYGVYEPPVSVDEAVAEMEAVIAEFAKGIELKPGRELFNRAYGVLSNIFEDIYQGAYNEAFDSLELTDKATLLCLAAQAEHAGFLMVWILSELLRYGGEFAKPIFKQIASHIDGDSNSPQEAAAAYGLAVRGCAQLMNAPPMYTGPDTPEHKAWQTIGKILFGVYRNRRETDTTDNRTARLWDQLVGDEALAAIDVLYSLDSGLKLGYTETPDKVDLVTLYPAEIETLLIQGLRHRASLTSIFSCFARGGNRNEDLALFAIKELGRIGHESVILVLQDVSDDSRLGAEAIAAIRRIRESSRS